MNFLLVITAAVGLMVGYVVDNLGNDHISDIPLVKGYKVIDTNYYNYSLKNKENDAPLEETFVTGE